MARCSTTVSAVAEMRSTAIVLVQGTSLEGAILPNTGKSVARVAFHQKVGRTRFFPFRERGPYMLILGRNKSLSLIPNSRYLGPF